MPDLIAIEVVDARAREQKSVALQVPAGTTLAEAIVLAGFTPGAGVGVFGTARKPEDIAAAGDRIEIYRALVMDPKDRRRRLVSAPR